MRVTLAAVRAAILTLGEPFTTNDIATRLALKSDAEADCAKSLLFHLTSRGELSKRVERGSGNLGGHTAYFSRTGAFGAAPDGRASRYRDEAAEAPAIEHAVPDVSFLQELSLAWDKARIATGRLHIGRFGQVALCRAEHAGD